MTIGREKRIVGLGPFYRNYDASAGDEIVIQKVISKNSTVHKIYCKKHLNSLVIQKVKDGFEILTPERQNLINDTTVTTIGGERVPLTLQFQASIKKRNDSPTETKIFDLLVNGISKSANYNSGTTLEIVINNNVATIVSPITWKKQIIETEDADR